MQQIISNYKSLVEEIDQIISKSPLKIEFLAKKLGLGRTSFYNKRRNKSFSLREMEMLINELSKLEN